MHPHPALRQIATAALALTLAACGGGGGEDTPAATPSAPAPADGLRSALSAPPQLPAATPPEGQPARCGNVSLGTQRTGEIQVPPGEVCVLQGTRVQGNIQLGAGSVLDARDVAVQGNVQAQGAASVLLAGGSVGGSVQLEQGGQASVLGVAITGNLQLESNIGTLTVQDNRVVGNLQCQGNAPAPVGGGNTAASLEDQCAALGGAGAGTPPPVHPPVAPQPPVATLPPVVPPAGDNVECRDQSLGALTVANVSVPAGARCELIGTVLTGSLQAQGAAGLRLEGAQVLGSLQWEAGGPFTASDTQVGGSVQVERATGLVWLQGLQVTGDIQLFDNRGGATLVDNRAGGNLQCKGNQPAPTGSGNAAASREDQCAGL